MWMIAIPMSWKWSSCVEHRPTGWSSLASLWPGRPDWPPTQWQSLCPQICHQRREWRRGTDPSLVTSRAGQAGGTSAGVGLKSAAP